MSLGKVAEAGPFPRFIIIGFGHLIAVYQHAASRIKRNATHKPITAVANGLCVEWHPTRACNANGRHDTWVA